MELPQIYVAPRAKTVATKPLQPPAEAVSAQDRKRRQRQQEQSPPHPLESKHQPHSRLRSGGIWRGRSTACAAASSVAMVETCLHPPGEGKRRKRHAGEGVLRGSVGRVISAASAVALAAAKVDTQVRQLEEGKNHRTRFRNKREDKHTGVQGEQKDGRGTGAISIDAPADSRLIATLGPAAGKGKGQGNGKRRRCPPLGARAAVGAERPSDGGPAAAAA